VVIGLIFNVNREVPLMHSFRVNPYIQDCEIWPQQTKDIVLLYDAKHISISETI